MIEGIEEFEHIFANEFVIHIDSKGDRVTAAVIIDDIIDIFKGSLALFVQYVNVPIFGDVVEVEVAADGDIASIV